MLTTFPSCHNSIGHVMLVKGRHHIPQPRNGQIILLAKVVSTELILINGSTLQQMRKTATEDRKYIQLEKRRHHFFHFNIMQ